MRESKKIERELRAQRPEPRAEFVDSLETTMVYSIAGQLGGAGIDVFDAEPIPADHPLLACQQVVLTPHNADQTTEGMELLNAGVVDNVIAFLKGQSRNRVV